MFNKIILGLIPVVVGFAVEKLLKEIEKELENEDINFKDKKFKK